jgi:hypothetical protein
MQRSATESFVQEKPPRYIYPDPQAQAGRLQKQTDFLRFVTKYSNPFISFHLFFTVVRIVLHQEQVI